MAVTGQTSCLNGRLRVASQLSWLQVADVIYTVSSNNSNSSSTNPLHQNHPVGLMFYSLKYIVVDFLDSFSVEHFLQCTHSTIHIQGECTYNHFPTHELNRWPESVLGIHYSYLLFSVYLEYGLLRSIRRLHILRNVRMHD